MDPTGKIGKQIGWLNKNAPLQEAISYSDCVGPLSGIDIGQAMKILKDLEERAEDVKNPTGYVAAAAGRAGAVGRGGGYGAAATDPTGKIARQVGWLNKNAELNESLYFNEVVGPLSAIDVHEAMAILKDLEEAADSVTYPTMYVVAAAKRRIGAASWGPPAASMMGGMSADLGKKISKQIGWLNSNVDLQEKLSYTDTVGPLSAIDISAAMKILKDLEESAPRVKNPTAYVIAAAERLGGRTKGKRPRDDWQAFGYAPTEDYSKKISRTVGWLNNNIELAEKLSYSDVAQPLGSIDITSAMKILKDLENDAPKIQNPTGYVVSAARRLTGAPAPFLQGGAKGGGSKRPRLNPQPLEFPANLEDGQKISKQIGWLNNSGALLERISYSDVKEPLETLDNAVALKILGDLERSAGSVRDPTSYVVAAAKRVLSRESPKGKGKQRREWTRKEETVEATDE